MQKIYFYIVLMLLGLVSCEQETTSDEGKEENTIIRLQFSQPGFQTRVVDADNLAVEQTINNLSLFFTEPSTNIITDKFIYTGFSISGDYQIVTLPIDPQTLLTKDIYVIANYNNQTTLTNLTSIEQMSDLHTPEVDKTNNLDPLTGFCMFGLLRGFDFTDTSLYPATIPLERTCAKMRVNVIFPEDPTLSTNNSFLIQQAAKYTYIVENATHVLPLSDYFNFAAATPLVDNGEQVYTNIIYVYEAPQAPQITVYVNLNDEVTQEFTAYLPIPHRNRLYDINIQIYEDVEIQVRSSQTLEKKCNFLLKVKVYDENGNLIDEF